MQRRRVATVGSLLLLAVLAQASRAEDILQHVPGEALGFVVAHDLRATDAKIQRLLNSLQIQAMGPLAFLRLATGAADGWNATGDLLVAVVPAEANSQQYKLCVWLPVNDYDRLVASLGGKPEVAITVINVAGEELLVTKQGDWALIMDPDQRARMDRLRAAAPASPELVSTWSQWITGNDVTLVVLSPGVPAILKLAMPTSVSSQNRRESSEPALTEGLFGPPGDDASSDASAEDGLDGLIGSSLRRWIGAWISASPRLVEIANRLQGFACGIRIDGDGNARLNARMAWPKEADVLQLGGHAIGRSRPSYSVGGTNGEFIVDAAGKLPPTLASVAAGTYLRLIVEELKTAEGVRLADATVARCIETVEQLASEAIAFNVVTLAGENHDGVYTNGFLEVQVPSADKFVGLAAEAMRLWNQMNRDAEGGPRLVFDVEERTIGRRTAVQYSLDVAAADGAPAIPEIRQAMEKLFGPGGKLTLLLAKTGDDSVLMAAATPDQFASALERLADRRSIDWNAPPLDGVNRLLPEQAEWRAFFSPHGFTTWSAREMDAIVGVPVIGGPLVKQFPATPPIGLAGGVDGGQLWVEVAVPTETIEGAGTYLQDVRARPRR